jgi:hypothetical protein
VTGNEFVAWIDELSEEHGEANVWVRPVRRSGQMVLEEVQAGGAASTLVIVD